jgi:hypothetical protein
MKDPVMSQISVWTVKVVHKLSWKVLLICINGRHHK